MSEENIQRTENTDRTEQRDRTEYTARRPHNKKQPETPVRTKLLTLQLICGAVIILILFLISRTGGSVSQNIGNFYSEIKKTDMAVSEVLGTLKNAAKETFAPINDIQKTDDTTGESEQTSPDIF